MTVHFTLGLHFAYIANTILNTKCNIENDTNANTTQVADSIFTYFSHCFHIDLNTYGNKGFIVLIL